MARMVSSGVLCMNETYSQTRSIVKTFGGSGSHAISEYYGAGVKNPGTTVPTSGTIKFSNFYDMAPLAKYGNGTSKLAEVSLASSQGEGFWRIAGSVTVPKDFTKARFVGSFDTSSSKIMKYKVGFAVGSSTAGYLNATIKNFDSGYAPWQRSGSWDTTQNVYIGVGSRYEMHVWLWGNRGRDKVSSGSMQIYV